jgi:hypothetical protein
MIQVGRDTRRELGVLVGEIAAQAGVLRDLGHRPVEGGVEGETLEILERDLLRGG